MINTIFMEHLLKYECNEDHLLKFKCSMGHPVKYTIWDIYSYGALIEVQMQFRTFIEL